MKTFRQKVLEITCDIPKGSVMTYKGVAKEAGNSKACRAVGAILKTNFDKTVPCHRVIRSDGKIGGYNRGGSKAKVKILHNEGVENSLIKN